MSKKMKWIIGACAGGAAVLIAFFVWLGVSISGKTTEAREAASGFVTLLQSGELERLSLEYYAYSTAENTVYTDENGEVKVQIITEQQMAEIFGAEAVLGTDGSTDDTEESLDDTAEGVEENISDEELIGLIMKHTRMQANVGTVWSDTGKMRLQMMIPDLKTWFLSLTEDDFGELNAIERGSDLLAEIEERIVSGEITQQYIVLDIPMIKQNGKWRFEVTEETEKVFYGGLQNLFD